MNSNEMMFTSLGALITASITILTMFIRHYLIKDSKKLDEGSQIRVELRLRCTGLEKRIDTLTEENEKWRMKYFDDMQRCHEMNQCLKNDVNVLTAALQDLKDRFMPKK